MLLNVKGPSQTPMRLFAARQPMAYGKLDTDSGSGLLPKFNRDFLVQGYVCDNKDLMKIR